jgi:hypothetical protein
MKRFLGIVIFAMALSTVVGCAARGYGRFGPPAERSYAGRVWVPGYDRWTGDRYRRVDGRWMTPPRHGQVWVPGYRTHRRGGYVWVEGHWR